MALGGKYVLPQLLHLKPTRLYLLGFSRQNLGAVAISAPPEQMDHDSRSRAPDIVRQPDRGILHLSLARLPSQLGDDLDRLGKAGRAYRVSSGLQAPGGVHGYLARDACEPCLGRLAAFALLEE